MRWLTQRPSETSGLKPLWSWALVLLAATAAQGGSAPAWNNGWPSMSRWAQTTPHPAVVRVIAPERDSISLGSGTLVAVNSTHGLILTNWHVVCDATGQIVVVFPDGFRTPAAVLRTDRDWDLAALAIYRPQVQPVPIAREAPRPGDTLTIAGYGSDSYRAVTGTCTQYVAPGSNFPYEMVELAAGARQGDSGGPIFNTRGELAGVLFGTSRGRTSGSYCGRVRWFLAPLGDFPQVSAGTMVAQQTPSVPQLPPPSQADIAQPPNPVPRPYVAIGGGQVAMAPAGPAAVSPPVANNTWRSLPPTAPSVQVAPGAPSRPVVAASPGVAVPTHNNPAFAPTATSDNYRIDQIKNILAVVGVLALFFHGLRLVSSLQG